MVTKFELPKVEDLHLTTVQFDSTCSYLKVEKFKTALHLVIFQIFWFIVKRLYLI